jgi:hypothetical protein
MLVVVDHNLDLLSQMAYQWRILWSRSNELSCKMGELQVKIYRTYKNGLFGFVRKGY